MNVVYTAITGNYDSLKGVLEPEKDLTYICFTNFEFEGVIQSPWLHFRLPPSNLSNKDLARFCKLNPHLLLPNFEKSLWIDGNVSIKSNVSDFINDVLNDCDVASYDHWWRDSVEQEFFACSRHGFDFAWKLRKQWNRYHNDGYIPKNFYENNVLIRRHMDSKVVGMHDFWWKEYLNGGKRDQYSFTYSAFKNGVEIKSLGIHDPRINKKYFDYNHHLKLSRGRVQFLRKLINRFYITVTGWHVNKPKRKNVLY